MPSWKKRHLFTEMPADELEKIARMFHPHPLIADEVLFGEGDLGESFYFIYSGNIRITRLVGQREKMIAVL